MRSCLFVRILFFVFLLHYSFTVPAQKNGAVFYHLTTKNGLSCNRTSAVIQDAFGFLKDAQHVIEATTPAAKETEDTALRDRPRRHLQSHLHR